MTDLEKAARMALEALGYYEVAGLATTRVAKSITALRKALEQPAQQEPAGQLMEEAYGRGQVLWFHKPPDLSMLYTLPPSKPWVGLTDEDIHALMNEFFYKGMQPSGRHFANFACAIEAKLREKNAITDLEQAALAQKDPCPGCSKGGVCRTPACGRLKLPVNHPYRTGIKS